MGGKIMENLQCLTCIEKHKNKMLIEQSHQKDLYNARLKAELEYQRTLLGKIRNLIDEFDDFSGEPSVLGIEIKKIISEINSEALEVK